MPIYAYRCESCGFGKDALQKMSDPQLTQCPECGKDTFRKQVTAAGFQLKGSGWYVTDFRGGNTGASAAAKPDGEGGSNSGAGENATAEKGAGKGAGEGAEKAAGKGAAPSGDAPASTAAAGSSSATATPSAPAAAPAASTGSSGSGSTR